MNKFHFYTPAFVDVERPPSFEFSTLEEVYEHPRVKSFSEYKEELEIEDLLSGERTRINTPAFKRFYTSGKHLMAAYTDGRALVVGTFEKPIE